MATPVYVEQGTPLDSDTGTTHEIDNATATQGNCILVVAGLHNLDEALTLDESGFEAAGSNGGTSGTDCRIQAWAKIAGASEPASYTVTHSTSGNLNGVVLEISGVNAAQIQDATATTSTYTANNASHTPAPIDTVTDDCLLFTLIKRGGGSSTDNDIPSGHTQRTDIGSGSGDYMGISEIDAGALGTQTPGAWTNLGTSADSAAITVVLRPTAGLVIVVPTGPWR